MAPGSTPQVRVGVGVFVLATKAEDAKNPRFLVGKRIHSHGNGTYATPGGHLEYGESPEECAARELREETGLQVTNVRFLTATNDYMPEDNKHYITLFMVCERENDNDEAQNLEPDSCAAWEWISWEDLLSWSETQLKAADGQEPERKLFKPFLSLL